MSLRVIVKSDQIARWITERAGTPARKRGTDTDVRVFFDQNFGDYEAISVDELIEAMRFQHLVMLVDQEAGKTAHRIYQHG